MIRLKLEKILENEGFTVFEAANIMSVKNNMFAKDVSLNEIDLVLLDIYLKEENGLELLEYLTENYPKIKVVMISVEARKSVVKKAINLGAKDYINKPFDKKILLKKLYSLIPEETLKDIQDKKLIEEKNEDEDEYKDEYKENKDLLKTNISLELNRSLRSSNPFSLVKMKFGKKIKDKKLRAIKETITGKIRNIDQIYLTGISEYIFLLPLTDQEGRKVFIDKITEELNFGNDENNQLKINGLTFPQFVLSEEEKPEYDNQGQYKKEIMQEILDNVVSLSLENC